MTNHLTFKCFVSPICNLEKYEYNKSSIKRSRNKMTLVIFFPLTDLGENGDSSVKKIYYTTNKGVETALKLT